MSEAQGLQAQINDEKKRSQMQYEAQKRAAAEQDAALQVSFVAGIRLLMPTCLCLLADSTKGRLLHALRSWRLVLTWVSSYSQAAGRREVTLQQQLEQLQKRLQDVQEQSQQQKLSDSKKEQVGTGQLAYALLQPGS